MARGNQRDKAREKAQKAASGVKSKNTMSGSEFAKAKEDAAAIQREKQRLADERKAAALQAEVLAKREAKTKKPAETTV